jgi:hypothetical protein
MGRRRHAVLQPCHTMMCTPCTNLPLAATLPGCQVYLETLSELQDRLPSFPNEIAWAVVEEEMGCPVGQIFDQLSEQPVAAASLGQVGSATSVCREHPEQHLLVLRVGHGVLRLVSWLLLRCCMSWAGCCCPGIVTQWVSNIFCERQWRTVQVWLSRLWLGYPATLLLLLLSVLFSRCVCMTMCVPQCVCACPARCTKVCCGRQERWWPSRCSAQALVRTAGAVMTAVLCLSWQSNALHGQVAHPPLQPDVG